MIIPNRRFVYLKVSEETFSEIKRKLEAKGWGDAVLTEENGRCGISMDGVVLIPNTSIELRMLTAGEAARILRLSKDRVYRLAKAGEIPSVRVGRSVRFRESDLREYLQPRGEK